MLVSYSDSEGSEDETPKQLTPKPSTKPSTNQPTNSIFALDKSSGKIKVNLRNKPDPSATNGTSHEDEPAAKRPRLGPGRSGGGAFSSFNAMLPAPKRDNLPPTTQNGGSKAPARKVFSLRTGAEPAFSRESDAELRNFFAEQQTDLAGSGETQTEATIPTSIPKPSFAKPAAPAPAGKPFMFKPLSVARNTKKKKPLSGPPIPSSPAATSVTTVKTQPAETDVMDTKPVPEPPKKKVSLFYAGTDASVAVSIPEYDGEDDEIIEDLGPAGAEDDSNLDTFQSQSQTYSATTSAPQAESLDNIANDLNLSAIERRQLFGRGGKPSASINATNVVNFNTDAEYAANQQLIASGERVQHNPVRAIAAGKHSLRQLVSSAAVQKDALEESFAQGRRNKKEAGNKYGW